ncbi:pyruvate,water dikinase [Deinobacterium chartae]|uniref:Pyruvate,water dikinase n=1 Tax=Deinobacterium chartae TaxID=521158 RepID=A0A841I3A8_9DEIO|nr:PEP/pyruvate-binding domain-containing protein [Deinobacterium chartae]MBB6099514.1 pyruvate,water dikinase [Deinobacterium chartae]
MSVVLSPRAARYAPVGGKARALAELGAAFPVPEWVVITPQAFTLSLSPQRRAALEAGEFEAAFAGLELDAAVRRELEAALARLPASSAGWAVRSSALEEDGAAHSFAGQFESYLSVPRDAVAARVVDVWRSGFARRAAHYRASRGLAGTPQVPAVIVQRMVPAEVAGVAFAADPVSSDPDVTVISAVRGLGDRLVSGLEEGQTYRLRGETPEDLPAGALLNAAGVRAVAALARRASDHFGSPQDIEWAMAERRLYLLQSRPITTLEEVTWWDNSNIVESYSGVTTPLTFSFAHRAYASVYRRFCALLGVPRGVIAAEGHTFDRMIGLVRGRVYYNLGQWYRVLALLPGFSVNRAFMEQMMGVAETMPRGLRLRTSRSKLLDALYLLRTAAGLLYAHLALPAYRRAFERRLRRVLRPPEPPLERRSFEALARYYRELEGQLLGRWDAPIVNDFFAMVFYGVLRRLCERWLQDADGSLQNDLIGDEGGMISAEPAERLRRMAALLRAEPDLARVLHAGDWPQVRAALADHPALRAEFDAYLARFGDRCVNELKLESPTLEDDPLLLARTIAHMSRLEVPSRAPGARRAAAEERAARQLSGWKRPVFAWVLREARARVRDRENLRFERTRVFGRARRIVRAMGSRLAERGLLDSPQDVFYLEVRDLLGYAEGTAAAADLAGLARVRRAEFERYARLPDPPRRFRTVGSVYAAPLEDLEGPDAGDPTLRRGVACSPGVVRGPVRVVRDPREVQLDSPAILVAERTDPGWIIVLPLARALIVERGSLLSHSAIVARELGIPGVVSLEGATRWLRDGDEVEIDGGLGTVRLLRRAGEVNA